MPVVKVNDMANTYIEHSIVIDNFTFMVRKGLDGVLCRVFSDGAKYKWPESETPVIPDASINCNYRDRRATVLMSVPRVVMEVLSDATESYDRGEKMELYKKVEVAEYWIVEWRKRQIEIYLLVPDENTIDEMDYKLVATVTESNKANLKLYSFPHIPVSFDEMFDGLD